MSFSGIIHTPHLVIVILDSVWMTGKGVLDQYVYDLAMDQNNPETIPCIDGCGRGVRPGGDGPGCNGTFYRVVFEKPVLVVKTCELDPHEKPYWTPAGAIFHYSDDVRQQEVLYERTVEELDALWERKKLPLSERIGVFGKGKQ